MAVDKEQKSHEEPLSAVVLNRIAEREGVPVEDLRPPLYETIDPDALESLFRDGSGKAMFEYLGYDVVVNHDGNVEVTLSSKSG